MNHGHPAPGQGRRHVTMVTVNEVSDIIQAAGQTERVESFCRLQ